MSEGSNGGRTRVFVAVALAMVSLAALIVAGVYFGGYDALMDSVSPSEGNTQVGVVDPVDDDPGDATQTADADGTSDPDSEADDSGDAADDSADDPASGSSGSDGGSSAGTDGSDGGGGTAAADPDLSSQLAWMYWEQVDSQEAIKDIVGNEWASFTIGSVNKGTSQATLGVSGRYRNGGSYFDSTMVLNKVEGKWYFTKITANPHTSPGPSGRRGADYGIVNTVVTQQGTASNQALIGGLMDGGYKTITVNSVSKGSGTATIDVTLSGGTKGRAAGRIVCVSKDISGRKYWFITRCEER